jgi:hypothetical protein
VLDYQLSTDRPAVRRLRCRGGEWDADRGQFIHDPDWVVMASTFDDFADYFLLSEVFTGVDGVFNPDHGRCYYWWDTVTTSPPIRCAAEVTSRVWLDRHWWEGAVDACDEHARGLRTYEPPIRRRMS